MPPASSRTISRSRSPRRSAFSGEIPRNGSSSLTGRTLTYRPRPCRSASKPLSGLLPTGRESHFGPPTAPRKTASALWQASSVALGSGIPAASMAAPPIGNSAKSNWWWNSCAVSRRTAVAARVTSGPIPSPGNNTMVFFMANPGQENRNLAPSLSEGMRRIRQHAASKYPVISSCGRGGFRRYGDSAAANYLVRDGYHVALANIFLLVGERRNAAIDLREFHVARFVSQIPQAQAQSVAPGVLAEDQRTSRNANGLRGNNFVRQWILDTAVLMDARFMGKGVRPHHGFVRRNRGAGNFGEHTARGEKLFQADPGGDAETLFTHRESHDDFLQRRVAGALADAVNGAFDLANTRAHRGQRIGDSHPQIIMAMSAQSDAIRIAQVFADLPEHCAIFLGHGIADGIGQVQHRRARIDGYAAHLTQELDIGAAGVFRGEFHFAHVLASETDHRRDGFERLLARHVQLHAKVQVGCRKKNVQPWGGGGFKRLNGGRDVFLFRARQR